MAAIINKVNPLAAHVKDCELCNQRLLFMCGLSVTNLSRVSLSSMFDL